MLEYLPPHEERLVTLDGHAVPFVEAVEIDRFCNIILDRRFGATIPAEYAEQVIFLLANALAIGAGFTCHGENSRPHNRFKVQVMEVDSTSRKAQP